MEKNEKSKKAQTKSYHLGFLSHNIFLLSTLKMHTNFEEGGSQRSWEICGKNLIGDKEENGQTERVMIEKEADPLAYNTTSHNQRLY